MEETKILEMIKNNPNIISTVENPTEEMKKLAVSKNGLVLEYIKNQSIYLFKVCVFKYIHEEVYQIEKNVVINMYIMVKQY